MHRELEVKEINTILTLRFPFQVGWVSRIVTREGTLTNVYMSFFLFVQFTPFSRFVSPRSFQTFESFITRQLIEVSRSLILLLLLLYLYFYHINSEIPRIEHSQPGLLANTICKHILALMPNFFPIAHLANADYYTTKSVILFSH